MKVRGIRPEDMPVLEEIHNKMGFGYPFPALRIQDVGKVLVDDQDRPVQAMLGVPLMEMYFLMSPNWKTPRDRFEAFQVLYREMEKDLANRGYGWAQADIPPEVEKSFGRRLMKLGWIKSRWASFACKVKNEP